jgi:hypothetical protein
MISRPLPVAPRMARRARVLHLVCQGVARDIAEGVPTMRAYSRGRARFNRSLVARGRGKLSVAAIRYNFARWKLNPSPSCFLGRWGAQGRACQLAPALACEIGRMAIREGLLLSELYQRERQALPCSASALYKRLSSAPFRAVRAARRKLDQVTAAALRVIEERTNLTA